MKNLRILALAIILTLTSSIAFGPARLIADASRVAFDFLKVSSSGNAIAIYNTSGVSMWDLSNLGEITGSNSGGNITIARVGKGLSQSSTTGLTAAGTTISDCLALSRVYNHVGTVGAGSGVCLWSPDASGIMEYVQNFGANDLKLYPSAAGGSINGAGTGNPITLAAATDDMAICWHRGSNNWSCLVGTGKAA